MARPAGSPIDRVHAASTDDDGTPRNSRRCALTRSSFLLSSMVSVPCFGGGCRFGVPVLCSSALVGTARALQTHWTSVGGPCMGKNHDSSSWDFFDGATRNKKQTNGDGLAVGTRRRFRSWPIGARTHKRGESVCAATGPSMRWPQADTPVVSVFRQGMPMSSLLSMLYNTSPGSLPVLLPRACCRRDRVTGGGVHEGCWSDHLCALGSSPGPTRRDPVSVCAVGLRVLSSGDAVHDTDRSEWTWHPQREAHTVERCGLAMLWISCTCQRDGLHLLSVSGQWPA